MGLVSLPVQHVRGPVSTQRDAGCQLARKRDLTRNNTLAPVLDFEPLEP